MSIDFIRNFGLNISFLLQQHNFPPKIESCLLTLEFLDVPWNWARPLISWRQTLLEIRVVLRREVLEMTLRSKKSAKIQFPTLTLIKLPISLSPPLFLEHCKVNWTDFTSSFENQCKDNVKNIFWVSISSGQKVRIVELVHIFEKIGFMPSCSSKKRKKTFTLSPWKRVFFSPARKLGSLHRVVTAPDRCLCIRIQQKFCLDCFHEYLIMVVTAARRMTTLGQLWDDFGTSLSVFHCSYLVVTATRTMSKKTRAPAPPAPITCSRWNRLLFSPLFFYNHQFVCVLPGHTELSDLN